MVIACFSGIDGDELSFTASYSKLSGDGIVEIIVENLAKKDLQFDETIKLQQWSTSEKIFELEQKMPVIQSGESAVISIEIPDKHVADLEMPLLDTDWSIFY